MSLARLLFTVATFASAFLIFLVQPMVGKRIVPWYGGVPAVWSLCLAFYQATLFAGYAYAHALIRFATPRLQLALHAGVLAAALLALPILPEDSWRPRSVDDPSTAILLMLGATVAPPFFALAATGPLVQAWFARAFPGRSPYPLYAISNLGSLLALASYPFVIEPRLSLSATGRSWSFAFALTGIAVLACAGWATRADGALESVAGDPPSPAGDGPPWRRRALWLLLAGCAVVLLMGVTNQLCLDTASVPFLWILPLGAYLISFILCFGSERAYHRTACVWVSGLAFVAPEALALLGRTGLDVSVLRDSIHFQIARHCVLLWGTCMVLHGELYRLRPPPSSLTSFYLAVAGGGALGGIFVGLVAPRVFDDYRELGIGLALAWLLLLAACWIDPSSWLRRAAPRWRGAVAALTVAGIGYAGVSHFAARPASLLHQERSFFGVLRVRESSEGGAPLRSLMNGTTLHGVQIVDLERPISYFGMQTGIGIAFGQREPSVPAEVGVIGLGIGTLAAYGRTGDRFRFYEIDPAVVRLARDAGYFTYLERSLARIEISEGDGRIALASERARGAPRFDLLIIDAYTSDAVPVHLLTRESFALYLDSLKETGVLGLHISSRHFALLPIVARLGHDLGLAIVGIANPGLPRHLSRGSRWAFLSRDERRIDALARAAAQRYAELELAPDLFAVERPTAAQVAATPLWRDDYSDLLHALRFEDTTDAARR